MKVILDPSQQRMPHETHLRPGGHPNAAPRAARLNHFSNEESQQSKAVPSVSDYRRNVARKGVG